MTGVLDHIADSEIAAGLERVGGNKAALARLLGVTRNALYWRLSALPGGNAHGAPCARVAVVTAAQNNVRAHPVFLAGLQALAQDLKAELHVIPFRYRNPSAMTAAEPIWFDDTLIGHFLSDTIDVGPVQVIGDMKIQATAINPVMGLQTMTRGRPTVIGHSQVQLESVARPQDQPPVWLHSSGAVTEPAFSVDTRAGRLAEHNHSFAAVVVSAIGQTWWMWQVIADDKGKFQFHETQYVGPKRSKAAPLAALALGDSHVAQMDPHVHKATFGKQGIVDVLKPSRGYVHDVFDGLSISHHDAKDPWKTFWKERDGVSSALDELVLTAKFLRDISSRFDELYVVPSNHNDWLDRWLKDSKPTPANEGLWFALNSAMRADGNRYKTAFQAWCERHMPDLGNIVFLPRGEAHLVAGVDYGSHGDEGINGGRSTAKSLARVAMKMSQGHSHSPTIEKGLWRSGMSTDLLDYVRGLTTADQSHVGQYAHGKRTQLPIRGGRWRP